MIKRVRQEKLIGISITYYGNIHYSKPFLTNTYYDEFKKKMCINSQLLRDVDFSMILTKGDTINIDIILYNSISSYHEITKNNTESSNLFIKLGSYNIIFDDILNDYTFQTIEKGKFIKKLDEQNDVYIEFSTILYNKSNNEFILTTPYIKGNEFFFHK